LGAGQRSNNWTLSRSKKRAKNPDLWAKLLDLCNRHEVEFQWVKANAGDPENERCDKLANQAARKPNLPGDEGYENPLSWMMPL
jgi:ribonuclease HI